jgi:purine-cytosine permease-like protein
MVSLATFKFGLVIAFVILGVLFAAFLAYMSTFGRKSSLRQKTVAQADDSI